MSTTGQSIAEIKEIFLKATSDNWADISAPYRQDERTGVQKLIAATQRKLDKEAAERCRLEGMYTFEDEVRLAHGLGNDALIVGLDEVGRGPLAGPVAIGAVVLDRDARVEGLNDSKKLSAARRDEIAANVWENALACTVQYASAQDIDEKGIAVCLRECFVRGIEEASRQLKNKGVERTIELVLLDGNPLHLDEREVNVIKGDGKSASIAAASIIAKVARDELMCELDKKYPDYGFAEHKGYGSAEHIEAIRKSGLSPVHRASFCKNFVS